MCLYKLSQIPRIALKPKTVYKIVIKRGEEYHTFYTSHKVELDKLYTGKFRDDELLTFLFDSTIHSGFIHSYKNDKEFIEEVFQEYIEKTYVNIALIKCEIPKFTLYYKGSCGDLASRKLKYIEEVKVLRNEK